MGNHGKNMRILLYMNMWDFAYGINGIPKKILEISR